MYVDLKLREIRRQRKMTQRELAEKSGVGEKTISSFESGQRTASMKLGQLRCLLRALDVSEREFFGAPLDEIDWSVRTDAMRMIASLAALPATEQRELLEEFTGLIDSARRPASRRMPFVAAPASDWELLNSRN